MYFKQIPEIVNGSKTQTRRIMKPGELCSVIVDSRHTLDCIAATAAFGLPVHSVYTPGDRLKWQVGRTYAVSPGRGKPGVMWKSGHNIYYTCNDGVWSPNRWKGDPVMPEYLHDELTYRGWKPLRILITAIRLERLQDMDDDDAVAEGMPNEILNGLGGRYVVGGSWTPIHNYQALWEDINGPGSWDANPMVWVLEFEVAR